MYYKRIIDDELIKKMRTSGAVLIVGPKGCGKTTSASQIAKTIVPFQDETKREQLFAIIDSNPLKILEGEKPILFDEWQDAPKLWGLIRKDIDDTQGVGKYILTGSSSKKVNPPHTGTLRISRLTMYPMSLYESGDSSGKISLEDLFTSPEDIPYCESEHTLDDIIYLICRGGWPQTLKFDDKEDKLSVAEDLFDQIYNVDISSIDGVKRSPDLCLDLLRSYSRNLCTLASNETIFNDVKVNHSVTDQTLSKYLDALKRLYIVEDINAWNPNVRSKTAIRSAKKRNLVDPSLAVQALGIDEEALKNDYQTLGFLFESLCIRDIKIYSQKLKATISYYRDRYNTEVDIVLRLRNGEYGLMECKLGGPKNIETGIKDLVKLEKLIIDNGIKPPTFKAVLVSNGIAHKDRDGVLIIPIDCLKD